MKTLGKILLSLVALLILIAVIVYAEGARLPVNHSVSVTGIVPAPPAKVFALITDVAHGPRWRHSLVSVEVLPPQDGPSGRQDHWRENLGHGQFMTFLATRTDPTSRREVLLDDPAAAYGGTWVYELTPAGPDATNLRITETGFIHPPIYRFMMAHIFGPTRNLDQYLSDIQAAAAKP